MGDRKLKILSGLLSIGLLTTLIIKLTNVPGGMILSGLYLGSLILIGILVGCIFVTLLLKLVFKKKSALTLYAISTAIAFIIFHYYLYSPTLKIIVPRNFHGEVNLYLSKVKENILKVDTNGIGYITQWTFNKTYSVPIVVDSDGKNMNALCIPFNESTFFGKGITGDNHGKEIQYLSFEILPKNQLNKEQYFPKDLLTFVDTSLLLKTEPDEYSSNRTHMETTIPINPDKK